MEEEQQHPSLDPVQQDDHLPIQMDCLIHSLTYTIPSLLSFMHRLSTAHKPRLWSLPSPSSLSSPKPDLPDGTWACLLASQGWTGCGCGEEGREGFVGRPMLLPSLVSSSPSSSL